MLRTTSRSRSPRSLVLPPSSEPAGNLACVTSSMLHLLLQSQYALQDAQDAQNSSRTQALLGSCLHVNCACACFFLHRNASRAASSHHPSCVPSEIILTRGHERPSWRSNTCHHDHVMIVSVSLFVPFSSFFFASAGLLFCIVWLALVMLS